MDHLVLVGEVTVELNGGCEREHRKRYGDGASLIAGNQKYAATKLDGDSDGEGQRRHRQSHSADHCCRGAIGCEFAKAAHSEGKPDHKPANKRKVTGRDHLKISLI